MFDTPLTVIGRIVTAPTLRRVGEQEVVRFRLASNCPPARRRWQLGAGQLAVRDRQLLGPPRHRGSQ